MSLYFNRFARVESLDSRIIRAHKPLKSIKGETRKYIDESLSYSTVSIIHKAFRHRIMRSISSISYNRDNLQTAK